MGCGASASSGPAVRPFEAHATGRVRENGPGRGARGDAAGASRPVSPDSGTRLDAAPTSAAAGAVPRESAAADPSLANAILGVASLKLSHAAAAPKSPPARPRTPADEELDVAVGELVSSFLAQERGGAGPSHTAGDEASTPGVAQSATDAAWAAAQPALPGAAPDTRASEQQGEGGAARLSPAAHAAPELASRRSKALSALSVSAGSESATRGGGVASQLCHNCEDPSQPPAVKCLECTSHGGHMLLCMHCDEGIHKPKKMRSHVREPLQNAPPQQPPSPASALTPTGGGARGLVGPASVSAPPSPSHRRGPSSGAPNLAVPALSPIHVQRRSSVTPTRPRSFSRNTPSPARASRRSLDSNEGDDIEKLLQDDAALASGAAAVAAIVPKLHQNLVAVAVGAKTELVSPKGASSPRSGNAAQSGSGAQAPLTRRSSRASSHAHLGDAEQQAKSEMVQWQRMLGRVFALSADALAPTVPLKASLPSFYGQVVAVACGLEHAGAITASGALFMWGSNRDGQLGCGDPAELPFESVPTRVFVDGDAEAKVVGNLRQFRQSVTAADRRVVHLACGYRHTTAATSDGAVFAWGSGMMGVLGQGGDRDFNYPKRIELRAAAPADSSAAVAESPCVGVAASQFNTACVLANGTVLVWGAGESGQIGNGVFAPQLRPTAAKFLDVLARGERVTSVSLGDKHALAVTDQGRLFAWGSNEFGQLGLGASQAGQGKRFATPQLVASKALAKVAVAACGERHSSVVSEAGKVFSCGSGETHQIGVLDNVDQSSLVEATGIGARVMRLSVGQGLTAAVTEAGEVYMWGFARETAVPQRVEELKGEFWQQVAVGGNDNVAALTGSVQAVYTWNFDQEGEDKQESAPRLFEALRGHTLRSVAHGKTHAAAVTTGGQVLVWGDNDDCQLGTGDDVARPLPSRLIMGAGPDFSIVEVRCSNEHSLALSATGRVYAWGNGALGRLGLGSDRSVNRPTLVEALQSSRVTGIAISAFNSAAVDDSGKLYMWGSAACAQLAARDKIPSFTPKLIAGVPEPVSQVALGNQHAVALTRSGKVYAWGNNEFGQLGVGVASEESAYPRLVGAKLTGKRVIQIDCGDMVSFALTDDGCVFGWGSAETQQLCLQEAADQPAPRIIRFPREPSAPAEPKITRLSIGPINCAALSADGVVYVWGWVLGDQPAPITLADGELLRDCKMISCGPHDLSIVV